MTIDFQKLRLDGVYPQDKTGHLMLRIKIPGWVLSAEQIDAICSIAEQCGRGILHLTSRGSIEFHWLQYENLEQVSLQLAAVGVTSRGACGGAVRGVSCSTSFTPGFARVQKVARLIHYHFSGNAEFEGLPKKFKVSVDSGYPGARHLIQDVGLVLGADQFNTKAFDLWCAGGLGREPQAGFLLEKGVPEARLLTTLEAIVQVYRDNTPPPKRLKFLLNQIGEAGFRKLLQEELDRRPPIQKLPVDDLPYPEKEGKALILPVFAGEIQASLLRDLSGLAGKFAAGRLAVTADQNIALLLSADQDPLLVKQLLVEQGIRFDQPLQKVNFRVCPGNHECKMGLVATREVASRVIREINQVCGDIVYAPTWAISGCGNSCSQPQLADFGIVTKRLIVQDDGSKEPRFDLYRRDGESLGLCFAEELNAVALYQKIRQLVSGSVGQMC